MMGDLAARINAGRRKPSGYKGVTTSTLFAASNLRMKVAIVRASVWSGPASATSSPGSRTAHNPDAVRYDERPELTLGRCFVPLAHVLLVEDDHAIRRGVADMLSFAGYSVLQAADGSAGLDAALSADLDLVLLDMLMPKKDGLEVLKELRKAKPSLPVIFLTARGEEEEIVRGLGAGADDYVVKPFGIQELLARIRAVLRRSAERPMPMKRLVIAGRTIDFDRREVVLQDGSRVTLSERESEVLGFLSANAGRAVSREELLSRVWGLDPRGVQTRTVDMTIARLRELLRDDPSDPAVVVTVRAKGYMLAVDDPGASGTPSDWNALGRRSGDASPPGDRAAR